jgi:hypothetical protein
MIPFDDTDLIMQASDYTSWKTMPITQIIQINHKWYDLLYLVKFLGMQLTEKHPQNEYRQPIKINDLLLIRNQLKEFSLAFKNININEHAIIFLESVAFCHHFRHFFNRQEMYKQKYNNYPYYLTNILELLKFDHYYYVQKINNYFKKFGGENNTDVDYHMTVAYVKKKLITQKRHVLFFMNSYSLY